MTLPDTKQVEDSRMLSLDEFERSGSFGAVLNPPGFVSFFNLDDRSAMISVSANEVKIRHIITTPRISSQAIIPFMPSMIHPFL